MLPGRGARPAARRSRLPIDPDTQAGAVPLLALDTGACAHRREHCQPGDARFVLHHGPEDGPETSAASPVQDLSAFQPPPARGRQPPVAPAMRRPFAAQASGDYSALVANAGKTEQALPSPAPGHASWYPPLPPSYYDAMRPPEKTGLAASVAEFRRILLEHISGLPQYVPAWAHEASICLSRGLREMYILLYPRSRLSQVVYTFLALCLLFTFTGSVFDAAVAWTPDVEDQWDWAEGPANPDPPLPFPGDGIVQAAHVAWEPQGCKAEAGALPWSWSSWCHAQMEFDLPLSPPGASGDLYFLADPAMPSTSETRTGGHPAEPSTPHPPRPQPDDRGSVRGTMRLVEQGPRPDSPAAQKNVAHVTVKAKYLGAAEAYFRASSVLRLARGQAQGIGIYTRPLQVRAGRPVAPRTGGRALLFDVTVRVPKGSVLHNINITTSGMDVILFDAPDSTSASVLRSPLPPSQPVSPDDDGRTPLLTETESSDEVYADSLEVRTGTGLIALGTKLARPLALRHNLDLTSERNSILLGAQASAGERFQLTAPRGGVRLLPHAQLAALASHSSGTVQAGQSIHLATGSLLSAANLTAWTGQSIESQMGGKGAGRFSGASLRLDAQMDVAGYVQPSSTATGTATGNLRVLARHGNVNLTLDPLPGTGVQAHMAARQSAEATLGRHFLGPIHVVGPLLSAGAGRVSVDPLPGPGGVGSWWTSLLILGRICPL